MVVTREGAWLGPCQASQLFRGSFNSRLFLIDDHSRKTSTTSTSIHLWVKRYLDLHDASTITSTVLKSCPSAAYTSRCIHLLAMSIHHHRSSLRNSNSYNARTNKITDDSTSTINVPLLAPTTTISQTARVPEIPAPPLLRLSPPIHSPDDPLPTQQPQINGVGWHPSRTHRRPQKGRRHTHRQWPITRRNQPSNKTTNHTK